MDSTDLPDTDLPDTDLPDSLVSRYLVGRYLAGELTPAERAAVERSVETDDPARARLALLRQVWQDGGPVPIRAERLDTLWRRIDLVLHQSPRDSSAALSFGAASGRRRHAPGQSGVPKMARAWRISVSTAALTIAACVAFATWHYRAPSSGAAVPTRVIASASGSRVAVTLDDGTHVLLNAGSRLRVPRDLERSRTVELDGEAMFTVSRHDGQPFVIRTRVARVAVLGTAFAVRSYPEDRRARVVVLDGRVSVRALRAGAAGEVVLGARMLAEVTDSGQTLLTPGVDVSRYTDWTRGRLVFRDAPLPEVLTALERRYGLVIRLTDTALARERLTATISDDAPGTVLDGIAVTFGVRYVREGNVITFLPHRPPTPRVRSAPLPELTQEMSYGR